MLPTSILDPILPKTYLAKVDSIISVTAPSSSGGDLVMFNNLRVDTRMHLIDQDPFAVFQNSTGLTATAVLQHHGSWMDRSWTSTGIWQCPSAGGYFLANPPANRRSGSLDDLPKGNADAIIASLKTLRSL